MTRGTTQRTKIILIQSIFKVEILPSGCDLPEWIVSTFTILSNFYSLIAKHYDILDFIQLVTKTKTN